MTYWKLFRSEPVHVVSLCKHAAIQFLPKPPHLILQVKNKTYSPCKNSVCTFWMWHILQKVSVGNLSWLSLPSLLSQCPIWLTGPVSDNYTQKTEWCKFWVRPLWLHINTHFTFSITGDDDSRCKLMQNQDQVSRRFVDDSAISLHLWDHMIYFAVVILDKLWDS